MALTNNAIKEAMALEGTSEMGSWIAVYTSGGSTEASGGSPAYARKQTTWTAGGSDGVVTGSQVEIDLPAGTYTHVGVFAASSGGTVTEKVAITSTTLGAQGKLLVSPVLTVT